MQAADKKRPKEEKDILHRLRPFARLQTAEDFEEFQADILCMSHQAVSPIAVLIYGQMNTSSARGYRNSSTTAAWAYGRQLISTSTRRTSPRG